MQKPGRQTQYKQARVTQDEAAHLRRKYKQETFGVAQLLAKAEADPLPSMPWVDAVPEDRRTFVHMRDHDYPTLCAQAEKLKAKPAKYLRALIARDRKRKK